ncbi:hypothetical protein SprV_0802553100 [Sparganum proliferum]
MVQLMSSLWRASVDIPSVISPHLIPNDDDDDDDDDDEEEEEEEDEDEDEDEEEDAGEDEEEVWAGPKFGEPQDSGQVVANIDSDPSSTAFPVSSKQLVASEGYLMISNSFRKPCFCQGDDIWLVLVDQSPEFIHLVKQALHIRVQTPFVSVFSEGAGPDYKWD